MGLRSFMKTLSIQTAINQGVIQRKKLLEAASCYFVQILNSCLHCIKQDFTSKSKHTYHKKQLSYEILNSSFILFLQNKSFGYISVFSIMFL